MLKRRAWISWNWINLNILKDNHSKSLWLRQESVKVGCKRWVSGICAYIMSVGSYMRLPLTLVSSGTPAAAAGSQSLGRQRSEQPWLQIDTHPSCSGWWSSGRPPPWWCCGTHLRGCSKAEDTAWISSNGNFITLFLHDKRWITEGQEVTGFRFRHKSLPVNKTGSAIQAALVDEADALFKMLQSAKGKGQEGDF